MLNRCYFFPLLVAIILCESVNNNTDTPTYMCYSQVAVTKIDTNLNLQSVIVTSPFLLYMHGNFNYKFQVFTSGMVQFSMYEGTLTVDAGYTFNIKLSYDTLNTMTSLDVWTCPSVNPRSQYMVIHYNGVNPSNIS